MTNIESYMNDGANWKAQMVLAYLRGNQFKWRERTWHKIDYLVSAKVGRYENGREQGYVVSVQIPNYNQKQGQCVQRNWAFYEHRNSDKIIVMVSDRWTLNTPTIDEIYDGRESCFDYDKSFDCGGAVECGKFINESIAKFVAENLKERDDE